MARGNGERGGGERSIGSRQLVGLFLGIVFLCCVFFILGYWMSRAQYEANNPGALSARGKQPSGASGKNTPAPETGGTQVGGESVSPPSKSTQPPSKIEEPPATKKSSSSGAPPSKSPPGKTSSSGQAGAFNAPLIPRGAIVLQVAALTKEQDALALAGALQEKGFPAFVLKPSGDNFFRVQVGPYADPKSAEQAKLSLEREGFKAILKR
jgi:cell division septation protein DedD